MSRKFLKLCLLFGGLLLLTGVIVFFTNAPAGGHIRGALLPALSPVLHAADAASTAVQGFALVSEPEIASSRAEIAVLREKIARLETALELKLETDLPLIAARVLRYDREFGVETLLIDRGAKDGITENAWVIDERRAAIGRILRVEADYASVSIASNPEMLTEVLLVAGQTRALARGLGARAFAVELLLADATTSIGDFIAVIPDRNPTASFILGSVISQSGESNEGLVEARAILSATPEMQGTVFIIKETPSSDQP